MLASIPLFKRFYRALVACFTKPSRPREEDELQEASSVNLHIQQYFDYFVRLQTPPQYALLISGKWGSGKTYLVQRLLRDLDPSDAGPLYISLYGVSSTEELSFALLSECYPLLRNKKVRVVTRATMAALRSVPVGASLDALKADNFIPKLEGRIIVFDDLERSPLGLKDSLGFVNSLVEHEGSKVIIIANEEEIEYSSYKRIKEKVIGKTLVVESSFEEAFDHFCSDLSHDLTRNVLEENRQTVHETYTCSELQNLRILKQTMSDFERLIKCIDSSESNNEQALDSLVRLFFALSFEARSGRISHDFSIINELHGMAPREENQEADTKTLIARYDLAGLPDMFFSEAMWKDILFRGLLDPIGINESYFGSLYFRRLEDEPSWKRVWHQYRMTDDEVEKAIEEMEDNFAKRKWARTGEIMHVFGLRLHLSRERILAEDVGVIVEQCTRYIDELLESERLDHALIETFPEVMFGYEGLGFFDKETPEFRTLVEKLKAAQNEQRTRQLSDIAGSLVTDLNADLDQFERRLTTVQGFEDELIVSPILHEVDIDEFVESIINMDPNGLERILRVLRRRVRHYSFHDEKEREKEWIEKVRSRIREVGETLAPIARSRCMWLYRCLDPDT